MLDDLGPRFSLADATDLVARLEHRATEPAMAAEVELGLLWAISQVAQLDIGPILSDSRPDGMSSDLFGDRPALIEITAVSDDEFSGRKRMDRAANVIGQYSDRLRKGASKHLHFQFAEQRSFKNGRFSRLRRVSADFSLTSDLKGQLSEWLTMPDWPNPWKIRLTDAQIDVQISWQKSVHPLGRAFSTMPPVAYDLERNPVFRALRRKAAQLAAAPPNFLKCIFLGDAGCSLLRELPRLLSPGQEVGADKIVRHFLSKSSVDFVCIFSPQKRNRTLISVATENIWRVHAFEGERGPEAMDDAKIELIASTLPRPRREAYQARDSHRQGFFRAQSPGEYLPTRVITKGARMTFKLSARLVEELFAGRITPERFQRFAFGVGDNHFERQLKRGLTIQGAAFEKAGLDQDDDYLVFEMDLDAAALPLKVPETAKT